MNPESSIEASVLSCLLQSPSEQIPAFLIRYRDAGEMFQDGRYAAIYEAAIATHEAGSPVDPISIWNALRTDPRWVAWRDLQWNMISGLLDLPVVASALDYYAGKLEELHIKRKILGLSAAIESKLESQTAAQTLSWLESEVFGIAKSRESSPEQEPISVTVQACIDLFSAAFESQGAIQGIPSGIGPLDRITNGFKPGQLIILAARPAMGKTSLAMNIVEHVAVQSGIPTGVFSIEMSKEELVQRAMCSLSSENFEHVQRGNVTAKDIHKIGVQSQRIAKCPLYIQDPAGINIHQLCSRARRMKRRFGILFMVVDYLGLIGASGKMENRVREMTQVTNSLKCLAKELQVPILALAQLNREVEKGAGREPRLSDLRESGSIEQDADMVLFLHAKQIDTLNQLTKLLVAKHRGGRTGIIELLFRKEFTRFDEVSPVMDDR